MVSLNCFSLVGFCFFRIRCAFLACYRAYVYVGRWRIHRMRCVLHAAPLYHTIPSCTEPRDIPALPPAIGKSDSQSPMDASRLERLEEVLAKQEAVLAKLGKIDPTDSTVTGLAVDPGSPTPLAKDEEDARMLKVIGDLDSKIKAIETTVATTTTHTTAHTTAPPSETPDTEVSVAPPAETPGDVKEAPCGIRTEILLLCDLPVDNAAHNHE